MQLQLYSNHNNIYLWNDDMPETFTPSHVEVRLANNVALV